MTLFTAQSTPTLSKGEFEKEAAFKERVLLEINKREAQVIALQEKYEPMLRHVIKK